MQVHIRFTRQPVRHCATSNFSSALSTHAPTERTVAKQQQWVRRAHQRLAGRAHRAHVLHDNGLMVFRVWIIPEVSIQRTCNMTTVQAAPASGRRLEQQHGKKETRPHCTRWPGDKREFLEGLGVRTRRTCTMTTVSCRQPQRATSDLSSGGAENTLSLNMMARPGMRVIGCPLCASYGGRLTTVVLTQAGCRTPGLPNAGTQPSTLDTRPREQPCRHHTSHAGKLAHAKLHGNVLRPEGDAHRQDPQ